MKVELLDFDQLPPELQVRGIVSNNGCGRECANYLRITHGETLLFLGSDAMEPEDARFTRDLAWVKDMIEQAYEIGKSERTPAGREEG